MKLALLFTPDVSSLSTSNQPPDDQQSQLTRLTENPEYVAGSYGSEKVPGVVCTCMCYYNNIMNRFDILHFEV